MSEQGKRRDGWAIAEVECSQAIDYVPIEDQLQQAFYDFVSFNDWDGAIWSLEQMGGRRAGSPGLLATPADSGRGSWRSAMVSRSEPTST